MGKAGVFTGGQGGTSRGVDLEILETEEAEQSCLEETEERQGTAARWRGWPWHVGGTPAPQAEVC